MEAVKRNEDREIFRSRLCRVGIFRHDPSSEVFQGVSRVESGYLLVFPRSSVRITHLGGEPVVADPHLVMFYNHGQLYHRRKVSDAGDLCDWFAFSPGAIRDALQPFEPSADGEENTLFRLAYGPSEPGVYLAQRLQHELVLWLTTVDRKGACQPRPVWFFWDGAHFIIYSRANGRADKW